MTWASREDQKLIAALLAALSRYDTIAAGFILRVESGGKAGAYATLMDLKHAYATSIAAQGLTASGEHDDNQPQQEHNS